MKDITDDRTAILAAIEGETEAYLNRDYNAWEQYWHDGPEIQRVHSHPGTGVHILRGEEIGKQMRRMLEERLAPMTSSAIRRDNFNIVISAEMAWVSYDQIGSTCDDLEELAGRYHELKILQKIEGAWKLTCIVGAQMRVDHVSEPLIEVTEDGRVIWMNTAAQDRLPRHPRLRRRGAYLRANKPDAQAGLLDALAWIAQVRDRHGPCVSEEAVSRAIALGQDDEGLAHICWAVLKDGKLLVTFDDKERLDRQLAIAGKVFGLSETQSSLARYLVEGCDIATASTALGVSVNTAKTHLQRIYDKTGVRAQPALVRHLLNADRGTV